MQQGEPLIRMKVLIIDDELSEQSANGRVTRALAEELRARDVTVVEAVSAEDGQAVVLSDPSLQTILIDWTMAGDGPTHEKSKALIDLTRSRNQHIPIFLMAERGDSGTLTMDVMRKADELIWM